MSNTIDQDNDHIQGFNFCLLNETVGHLKDHLRISNESATQSSNISLNFLKVPEFRGRPDEDIVEFLSNYERATSLLNDEQKCLALPRALFDAAATWAESVKKDITAGKWKKFKKSLIERFGDPNIELRYRQKLSSMKYNSREATLLSFVESYVSLYSKVFPGHRSNEVIQSLRLNLQPKIVKNINLLDDNWVHYEDLDDLYKLIRRYEINIKPFEETDNEHAKHLNIEGFGKMLTEFKKEIVQIVNTSKEKQETNLAIMKHENPDRSIDTNNYRYPNNYPYHQKSDRYHFRGYNQNNYSQNNHGNSFGFNNRDYNIQNRRNYQHDLSGTNCYKNNLRNNDLQRSQPEVKRPRHDVNLDPQEAYKSGNSRIQNGNVSRAIDSGQVSQPMNSSKYFVKFGHPPGPCYNCGGNHFNRHCPLVMSDLN